MARQAKPKIDDVSDSEVIKNVDLSDLKSNRFTGKSITKIEHCLLEVLAYIIEDHKLFNNRVDELVENCINSSEKFSTFLHLFSSLKRCQGMHLHKFSNYSETGLYFRYLEEKLISAEESQFKTGKPNTVKHALMLAELINNQLALCSSQAQKNDHRIERLWNSQKTSNEERELMIQVEHTWLSLD